MASILESIGNTPLVELQHIAPQRGARIVAKLETANPTGSMKDRLARHIMGCALKRRDLGPGGVVVDYTAGTTGISLAFVARALGLNSHFVFSDAFSAEKRLMMQAFGATVTDVGSNGGRIDRTLVEAMIAMARTIAARPGHWWADQLNNEDGAEAYATLGEEIWRQTGGRIDVVVHAVSTGHSLLGMARALRRSSRVACFAVEPAESPVLSGGTPGPHRIEGIGIGFKPPLWRAEEADGVIAISGEEAAEMARRLAREEAIFAGISTGANVAAALRVAESLPAHATVATVIVDSGLRYLSGSLFGDHRHPLTREAGARS